MGKTKLEAYLDKNYDEGPGDRYSKKRAKLGNRSLYWKFRVNLDPEIKSVKEQEVAIKIHKYLNLKRIDHKTRWGISIIIYPNDVETAKKMLKKVVPLLLENPKIVWKSKSIEKTGDTVLVPGLSTRYEVCVKDMAAFCKEVEEVFDKISEKSLNILLSYYNLKAQPGSPRSIRDCKKLETMENPPKSVKKHNRINDKLKKIAKKHCIIPVGRLETVPFYTFARAIAYYKTLEYALFRLTYIKMGRHISDKDYWTVQNVMKKEKGYKEIRKVVKSFTKSKKKSTKK